ncbi:MAG TPA: tetratricopeptide repeat protein [Rectinemataceae bacterium]
MARRRPRARLGIAIISVAVLALAVGGVSLFLSRDAEPDAKPGSKNEILAAWKAQDMQKTLDLSRASLETRPFDPFSLSFDGIASYYLSLLMDEGEERHELLDEAVFSLRKALALGKNFPVRAQVEYVLGKAYYQKGEPWYDLSVKYLELSKASGYLAKDAEQYLGLAYVGLGDHRAAVERFEAAIQAEPRDVLMLSAALSYKELGEDEKSEAYLSKVAESTMDEVLALKARSTLAEMAIGKGEFHKAESLLLRVVEKDPEAADAWYLLGLVYEASKDPIKARAAWRKATSINPNHIEARKRLAERL